jgi:UDP-glucose 4-epimerase
MKIFLTGGTGFIGSHVLRHALAAGHEVTALRRAGAVPKIKLAREPDWIEGALDADWKSRLKTCDVLIHLAAAGVNSGKSDWRELFAVNVTQSLNLWLQAADAGVKRLVICGSCFEFGRTAERLGLVPADAPLEPTGPYHSAKAAATMAALGLAVDLNLEVLVLRPFHVYGEGEALTRFWPALRAAALAGQDFPMTAGEQVRDFVPVETAAKIFVEAATRTDLPAGRPKVENLGTGKPQTLRAFAGHWWKTWNAQGRLQFGAVPYRENEVMRYVPLIPARHD